MDFGALWYGLIESHHWAPEAIGKITPGQAHAILTKGKSPNRREFRSIDDAWKYLAECRKQAEG